eukprot:gb/GEZN01022540.1/.p1 GENE.gb/GEZN01022540.1/~~gb/GEZN01022540.1/.p1  ORF type:complete len:137 (+),score=11.24 gb/GEZN01022540.1/:20-430(+)
MNFALRTVRCGSVFRATPTSSLGCVRVYSTGPTTVQETIHEKLSVAFSPLSHLKVTNDSNGHNVPKGSETHFSVHVVSQSFEGKTAVARHRMVHKVLEEELNQGVHALAIKAQTPSQFTRNPAEIQNPKCSGGSKR